MHISRIERNFLHSLNHLNEKGNVGEMLREYEAIRVLVGYKGFDPQLLALEWKLDNCGLSKSDALLVSDMIDLHSKTQVKKDLTARDLVCIFVEVHEHSDSDWGSTIGGTDFKLGDLKQALAYCRRHNFEIPHFRQIESTLEPN